MQGAYERNKGEAYTFKRPSDLETTPKLWGDKITENDIGQGGLGDCWLLAAISAIGEFPHIVKDIFPGVTEYPKNGMLKGNIYMAGKKYSVTIDDQLFTPKNGRWPFHSKRSKKDGSWWGPMVEKLAAKAYGTYETMHGGSGPEGFYLLTGQTSHMYYFNTYSDEEMKSLILMADNAGYPMTAPCDKATEDNLVPRHAYTLVGMSGDKVKLRNPWAVESYKIKDGQNDGVITVPWSRFKEAFRRVTINYYRNDWKFTEKEIEIVTSQPRMQINNPVSQDAILGITNMNNRHIQNNKITSNYRGGGVGFEVLDQANARYTSSIDKRGHVRVTWGFGAIFYKNLPAGDYTLRTTGQHTTKLPVHIWTRGAQSEITFK